MENAEEDQNVIKNLNGSEICRLKIVVNEARN
jgi:hypothetical protein